MLSPIFMKPYLCSLGAKGYVVEAIKRLVAQRYHDKTSFGDRLIYTYSILAIQKAKLY